MRVVLKMAVRSTQEIDAALEALTRIAELQLRSGRFGKLYGSGVRYKREAEGRESWQSPVEVFAQGHGDCEDLAAIRAAELRIAGLAASAVCYSPRPGLVHCVVEYVKGGVRRREDPSKILGMGGDG